MNGLAETQKVARFPKFRHAATLSKLFDLSGSLLIIKQLAYFGRRELKSNN
jgi:hypothetical protein